MVLGLSVKTSKASSLQVNYLIHIHEIKPWPPSQSLRSLRNVLIQWENGDRNSGSTDTVAPSLGSVVGEGKIEFNHSFRLPVTLLRETPIRGRDTEIFQKNIIEFNLYEPRREKTQLLATATVNLADYGIVKESLSLTAPVYSKRSFRNTSQPMLYFQIHPVEKGRACSSSSLGKNGSESVSTMMNEEYAEEAETETVSFAGDDIASHSSLTASSSSESNGDLATQSEENGLKSVKESNAENIASEVGLGDSQILQCNPPLESVRRNLSSVTLVDLICDDVSAENNNVSVAKSPSSFPISIQENHIAHDVYSSSPFITCENKTQMVETSIEKNGYVDFNEPHGSSDVDEELGSTNSGSQIDGDEYITAKHTIKRSSENINMHQTSFKDAIEKQNSIGNDASSSCSESIYKTDILKRVKSVRSLSDGNQPTRGVKQVSQVKDTKIYPKDTTVNDLDIKVQQLEDKVKKLEGELREAAAIEAALYSVVAEHGSSMSKVHAPARRLSRLYLHACREKYQIRKASAARSVVSGLVLVAKSCGNDVPRLTFWLSNSVTLRAIISREIKDMTLSSPLKWNKSPPSKKESITFLYENTGDWQDPRVFVSALEKVEAWIFSRAIESIWWQTLTPHMHSGTTKAIEEEHGNFSLQLWKNAFKDACERLCPVKAGGHSCGCLPVLARMIMEQCVARLDVAMFNAILRESADEMPTDPLSDPISDSAILPIEVGKPSFGAGAQLKNAIGNWSRWLTDLFGIDDEELLGIGGENEERQDTSFKSFHLLNALSDLMMLPKDMLLSRSIRKEVCPIFGVQLIGKVLDNFVPDEFCPDPIPDVVFEAINSEEDLLEDEDCVINSPFSAAPPVYSPPSAVSISALIGEEVGHSQLRRSGSSVLRKSYNSDDELEELSSPMESLFSTGFNSSFINVKQSSNGNGVRYQLLREI